MKNKESSFCNILDKFLGKAIRFILNMDLNKTLNVFKINQNSLSLDFNDKTHLYCTMLINDSNVYKEYNNFEQLHKSVGFNKESKVFLYFVKKGLHQAIYVFSLNENICRQIATSFGTNILSGEEIIEAIHDIFLIPERRIENNSYINQEYESDLDVLYKQLPSRISIATNNIFHKYNIYQGTSYQINDEFNPVSFFNRNWNGVFCISIDFSNASNINHITMKKNESAWGDKKMNQNLRQLTEEQENKDTYEKFISEIVIVNSLLFIDNADEVSALSNELKISFQENYLTTPKILPKTLINSRDATFDLQTPAFNVKKYFISTHKRIIKKVKYDRKRNQKPDFYGKDINGSFINYSFYGENSNPHSIITGPAGSGKSVGLCKILQCGMGLDLQKNIIENFRDTKFKICDVGYTIGGLVEKARDIIPEEVQVLESKVQNLKFSLFEIGKDEYNKVDVEDIKFTVYFINTILEVSKTDILTQMEEDKLIEAIKDLIEGKYTINLTLNEIKNMGFRQDVENMLNDGYSEHSKIKELKEDKYQKFKSPTLFTLISRLEKESSRTDLSNSQKNIFESLITKISSLKSSDNFTTYSNVDFKKNYFLQYIDFDSIKDDPKLFTSAFWMLFQKWYKMDKKEAMMDLNKGKTPKASYYVIEEAHNFFKIESFKKLLEVAAREARKYHIYLIFVTQRVDDIPDGVFSSIASRIYFFAPSKRSEIKRAIERKIGGEKYEFSKEEENVFNRIKAFQAFITTDNGFIGCDLMATQEELRIFTPKQIN